MRYVFGLLLILAITACNSDKDSPYKLVKVKTYKARSWRQVPASMKCSFTLPAKILTWTACSSFAQAVKKEFTQGPSHVLCFLFDERKKMLIFLKTFQQ